MYQTLKEGRKVGSWRERGEEEKEREKREWKPSKERDWPLLGAAIGGTHLCGLLRLVSENGPQAPRREERSPWGRKLCILAECPSHWPCQEVCRLTAGSWEALIFGSNCWQHLPLLPQVVSGACCCLYNPLHQIRGPGKRPLCKALQEFVIYRRETPLGVWTQTPKR